MSEPNHLSEKINVQARAIPIICVILLALQVGYAWHMWQVRPHLGVLPEPPSHAAIVSLAVGDKEMAYRLWSLRLQNAGDGFGRVSALQDYDYGRVQEWLERISLYSDWSHWLPSLASYYFSLSQDAQDTRYVIAYLEQFAEQDPATRWWWLAQATYIARSKLEDEDEALRLAKKLSAFEAVMPIWARQLPAFIYEAKGDEEAALAVMLPLLENFDALNEGEQNYMLYFITERMKAELPEMYDKIYRERGGAEATAVVRDK